MKTIMNIEEVLRNGNSSKNQEIKRKFVAREIYCNVGTLVEYCLNTDSPDAPVNLDELENFYSYPEYNGEYAKFEGGTEEERDAEIERLQELLEEATEEGNTTEDYTKANAIEEEITALNELETEPQEVYEWWAISSWLYEKLQALGYVVCDAGSCHVWGRCTTGQAILLDYVITKICADMGILEGQENEWSV